MKAFVAIICFASLVMPLMAHHSFAMYDQSKTLTFTGVATTYTFSPSQHAGFNAGDLALLRFVGQRSSPALR